MTEKQLRVVTRRGFLRDAGVVGLIVAAHGVVGLPPPLAHADASLTPEGSRSPKKSRPSEAARAVPPTEAPTEAPTERVHRIIAEHMGDGPVSMEKITLDIPDSVDDATLVHMPIVVDYPMQPNRFIQTIGLFIDKNPSPFIAKFDLTPAAGRASVEFRVRMAEPSNVRVIAKSNTGKLYGLLKHLHVSQGGCEG